MTQQIETNPRESPALDSISITSLSQEEVTVSRNALSMGDIIDEQESTVSEEPKLRDFVMEQSEVEPNLDGKIGKGESGRQKWNDCVQALYCCTLCAVCFNQCAACFEIISECA